jgi:hypothetical protein
MFRKNFPLLALGLVTTLGVACGGDSSSTPDAPASTAPACTSSGKNAFETYGATAFLAVNTAIINNTLAEVGSNGSANLGEPFLELGSAANGSAYADNATTFTGKLAAFLVFAYGGPSTTTVAGVSYNGDQDMVAAHTGMNITASQFTYFVTNEVVPALASSGVGSADISSCFAPVVTSAAFQASIVGH